MRITGGTFRSRSLVAPRGHATRPTQDRVREALFSVLVSRGLFTGAPRVLDLYAGTGALALEALSRGAGFAVMVEQGRDALRALRENVAALGLQDRTRVQPTSVEKALSLSLRGPEAFGAPFDLVFADPPYADLAPAAKALGGVIRLLSEGALVVVEHACVDPSPTIDGLQLDTTRTYGDTVLALFSRQPGLGPQS